MDVVVSDAHITPQSYISYTVTSMVEIFKNIVFSFTAVVHRMFMDTLPFMLPARMDTTR